MADTKPVELTYYGFVQRIKNPATGADLPEQDEVMLAVIGTTSVLKLFMPQGLARGGDRFKVLISPAPVTEKEKTVV